MRLVATLVDRPLADWECHVMSTVSRHRFQAGDVLFWSRRAFLRASTVGLGAMAASARGSEPGDNKTACIVFFLDGGPSHLDTFDVKPEAPAEVRGQFSSIDTSVPGIRISDQLPLLATQAEHFALVRSIYHGNPSHAPAEHQMLTGWMGSRPGTARAVIENPSFGSVVARLRGVPRGAMPPYVAIPWSFHHGYGGSPFGAASYLGPRYEPFESGHLPSEADGDYEVPALRLPQDVPTARLRHRYGLLGQLEPRFTAAASTESVKRMRAFSDIAFTMLENDCVRKAFDLDREPRALREQYGSHDWGQGALLSRRLVEAGVTFIMMQCGLRQDWDTHTKNFSTLKDKLLPPLDRAVSTLLADLSQRGLLEKTLVMVLGEFGRTPKIGQITTNNTTDYSGRDHWANCFSCLIAGGGLKTGQVVGASDRIGAYPRDRALHAKDLFATMYHVLGVDYRTTFYDRLSKPIPVLSHGQPIRELL